MINNKFTKITLVVASIFSSGCLHDSLAGQSSTQNQKLKNSSDVVKTLQALTQYEIDGSFLLSQCMDNLKSQDLKTKLISMKSECEEAITDLSDLVKKYGGDVPEYSKDFKGYFMNGYSAMRGAFTDKGALNALYTNLNFILKASKKAANDNSLPSDVKDTLIKINEKKVKSLQDLQAEINKL